MLRYVSATPVFQEIPGETSLAINISGCPCHCPGCHSRYLWAEKGAELDSEALDTLVGKYRDRVTCICFMGGDGDTDALQSLAQHLRRTAPELRVAWYSGRTLLPKGFDKALFHYIKLGPYLAHLGPLTSEKTNQRLYRIEGSEMVDITYLFRRKLGLEKRVAL